ncbi:MAG TPA: hypothetical protein VER03_04440, partial [Bryobacteraceae bacterium]|nr:hypothetical protein [Bryobacteraceae bacterium]
QAVKSENLPNAFPTGTCVLASEAHAVEMQERLPAGVPFRPIQLRSMQEVIAGQERPSRPVLICVVSGSKAILQWSATLLSALGFSPDGVIQRNSCEPGWELGLGACDIVAVDVVTARRAPASLPLTVFRIVSDDFLAALKDPVTDQEL